MAEAAEGSEEAADRKFPFEIHGEAMAEDEVCPLSPRGPQLYNMASDDDDSPQTPRDSSWAVPATGSRCPWTALAEVSEMSSEAQNEHFAQLEEEYAKFETGFKEKWQKGEAFLKRLQEKVVIPSSIASSSERGSICSSSEFDVMSSVGDLDSMFESSEATDDRSQRKSFSDVPVLAKAATASRSLAPSPTASGPVLPKESLAARSSGLCRQQLEALARQGTGGKSPVWLPPEAPSPPVTGRDSSDSSRVPLVPAGGSETTAGLSGDASPEWVAPENPALPRFGHDDDGPAEQAPCPAVVLLSRPAEMAEQADGCSEDEDISMWLGWTIVATPEGRMYYHHEAENKASWTQPPELRGVLGEWKECRGPAKNQVFYMNELMGMSVAKDPRQTTNIFQAALDDNLLFMSVFSQAFGDLEARDPHGRTPLHYAASSGSEHAVHFLLQKGVEVNVQDQNGCTPFLFACRYNHKHIIKLLHDNFGSAIICDDIGNTPLHEAAQRGWIDVAHMLVCCMGASTSVRNRAGLLPFELAAACRQFPCQAYLQKLPTQSYVPYMPRPPPQAPQAVEHDEQDSEDSDGLDDNDDGESSEAPPSTSPIRYRHPVVDRKEEVQLTGFFARLFCARRRQSKTP